MNQLIRKDCKDHNDRTDFLRNMGSQYHLSIRDGVLGVLLTLMVAVLGACST